MDAVDPILSFWLSLIVVLLIGLGLLIDLILIAVFWERLPKFFRQSKIKAKVPWVFRDLIQICCFVLVFYCFSYLSHYFIWKAGWLSKQQLRYIAGVTNTTVIYLGVTWFVVRLLREKYQVSWSVLGFKWRSWWSTIGKGSLFYFGFFPLMAVLTYISLLVCTAVGVQPEPHPLVDILKTEKSAAYINYLLLIAVFVAPFFEEIIFRGVIYQFLRKYFGVFSAAILSSVVFSLLHFNTAQFLPVLGLGVLLCLVFEYTGSLVSAIAVHILNNGLFLGLFLIFKQHS